MIESTLKSPTEPVQLAEHYRICSPRRVAAVGPIFNGEDLRSGQEVALTQLADALVNSERARERLQTADLGFLTQHHPSLLSCYWFGTDSQQRSWLVYANPSGKTCQPIMPMAQVQKLLLDIGEALAMLHQQGILHQAVTPSSLYITELQEVELAQLGLAQVLLPNRLLQILNEQDELEFIAPEQRQGLVIDAAADQYSLAACALWLLTGKKPSEISWTLLSQAKPVFIPDALLNSLRKALNPVPEQRFPDIESFCLACQGLGPQGSLFFRMSPSLTAVVLLLVFIAVVMLWIRHQQPTDSVLVASSEQVEISPAQREAIPVWKTELASLYQNLNQQQAAFAKQLSDLDAKIASLTSQSAAVRGRERERILAERKASQQQRNLLNRVVVLVQQLAFTPPDEAAIQKLLTDPSESEQYDLAGLSVWRQKLQQQARELASMDSFIAAQDELDQLQERWRQLQEKQVRSPRELRTWLTEATKQQEEHHFIQATQKIQQVNALYRSLLSRLPEILQLRLQCLALQNEWQNLSYRLALFTPEARRLQDQMAHAELKFSQGQLDELTEMYKQIRQGYNQQLSLSQSYREAENAYLINKQQWLDYVRRNQLSLELPPALDNLEQEASNLTGKELERLASEYYPRLGQGYRDWLMQLKEQNRKNRLSQWSRPQAGRLEPQAAPVAKQDLLLLQFKNKAAWLKQIQSSMVEVSAGQFFMGGVSRNLRPGTESYSSPKHQRQVTGFRISDHEVTFAEFDFYSKANKLALVDDGGFGRGNRPVINLNYNEVMAYIRWLNEQAKTQSFRLPTEAEWEFVAWAGRNHADQWQLNPEENLATAHCQSCLASRLIESTLPVGSLLANPWGLYDLFGNVAEWTADCWHPNYQHSPQTSQAWREGDCQMQVVRGGSYQDKQEWLNPLQRDPFYRQDSAPTLGFRLAQSLAK